MKKTTLAIIGAVVLLIALTAWATSTYENKSASAFAGACVDGSTKSATLTAPTGSSTTIDITNGAAYELTASGGDVYIACDDGTPTATTSAGGYAIRVPAGMTRGPYRFRNATGNAAADKCAYIAATSSVTIEFLKVGIDCY